MIKAKVRYWFFLSHVVLVGCTDVDHRTCVNGSDGIDEAAAYVSAHWPDAKDQADYLLVSCKDQHTIETSISSCATARVQRPESCAVHRASTGRRARIDVSHDEDAAISVCHELQHLRDAVWIADDGCQSHLISCHYDAAAVARCEQAVRTYREHADDAG